MPELPDVTVYCEAIAERVIGTRLLGARLASPFVLRSVEPPLSSAAGRTARGVSRLGKRIVIELEGDLFLVVHLMIAGRFRWAAAGKPAKIPGRIGLAAFDFESGSLLLTEASPKKRASIRLVAGRAAVDALSPGGLEPIGASLDDFRHALLRENHTLRRSLTDPHLFSGIGGAFSDEILHAARLSPMKQTKQLSDGEIARLHAAAERVLLEWTERLREERAGEFPEKVTAFREGFAVHGRAGLPCPDCGAPVQRIAWADNETNYCAKCQTEGRLLADRALSRLLREDWPKSLEELEERKGR